MYPSANLPQVAIDGFMSEWALIVDSVGTEAFDAALAEHIRNAKFFPSVAELRERAGMKKETSDTVDADEAWNWVIKYLQSWGVNGMSQRWGGKEHFAPTIPERIGYAIRRVGGLNAINLRSVEAEPFMRKEFAEAYKQAPIAEAKGYLSGSDAKRLMGSLKQLADGKVM